MTECYCVACGRIEAHHTHEFATIAAAEYRGPRTARCGRCDARALAELTPRGMLYWALERRAAIRCTQFGR
jgi:hypothetical protein